MGEGAGEDVGVDAPLGLFLVCLDDLRLVAVAVALHDLAGLHDGLELVEVEDLPLLSALLVLSLLHPDDELGAAAQGKAGAELGEDLPETPLPEDRTAAAAADPALLGGEVEHPVLLFEELTASLVFVDDLEGIVEEHLLGVDINEALFRVLHLLLRRLDHLLRGLDGRRERRLLGLDLDLRGLDLGVDGSFGDLVDVLHDSVLLVKVRARVGAYLLPEHTKIP